MLKRILAVLFILCLLPFSGAARAESGESFTLLVYMTGSNLESEGEAASADLKEMMAYLSANGGIRILVHAGGSVRWGLEIDPEKSTRLEIRKGEMEIISETGRADMGETQTLADFLQWGYEYAPADHYGLILWNHGAGPLLGVCFDEQYKTDGNMDSLSMAEFGETLAGSPFAQEKLCFIGFDACLMCTMEVASLAAPYADYMIASQETEPASGWNYAFLSFVRPGDDGGSWGHRVVSAYRSSLKDSTAPATLACLDLGKTEDLTAALDALFGDITASLSEETYALYTRCRAGVKSLGVRTTYDYDLIDLADLLNAYEAEGLADVSAAKAALEAFVTEEWSVNADSTNGLSIYYPFDNKTKYMSPWSAVYDRGSSSPTYRAFIREISGYFLRDALFNKDSEFPVTVQGGGGRQMLQIPLTEEEAANLVRWRMLVLEEIVPDYYRFIYYDDQKQIRATDRSVMSVYSGEALYMTDPDGNILAGPVSYLPVENGVAVYCRFEKRDYTQDSGKLIYQWNDEGKLVLSQITMFNDVGNDILLPSAVDLDRYLSVYAVSLGPQGAPVTSLDYQAYAMMLETRLDPFDGSWEFSICKEQNRNRRFAYIRLTDVNGETVCSEVVEIPATNVLPVAGRQELTGPEGLDAALESVELVTGYDAGLKFSFEFHNTSDSRLDLRLRDFTLAGVSPEEADYYDLWLAPDETDCFTLFISLDTLRKMDLPDDVEEGAVTFLIGNENVVISFPLSMNTSIFSSDAADNP